MLLCNYKAAPFLLVWHIFLKSFLLAKCNACGRAVGQKKVYLIWVLNKSACFFKSCCPKVPVALYSQERRVQSFIVLQFLPPTSFYFDLSRIHNHGSSLRFLGAALCGLSIFCSFSAPKSLQKVVYGIFMLYIRRVFHKNDGPLRSHISKYVFSETWRISRLKRKRQSKPGSRHRKHFDGQP